MLLEIWVLCNLSLQHLVGGRDLLVQALPTPYNPHPCALPQADCKKLLAEPGYPCAWLAVFNFILGRPCLVIFLPISKHLKVYSEPVEEG